MLSDLPDRSIKVLISGTNNLFGKALVQALLSQGMKVFVINSDDSVFNLQSLSHEPNLKILEGSLLGNYKLEKGFKLNYVFDVNSFESLTALDYTHLVSQGTKNLLHLALETTAEFVLFSSTGLKIPTSLSGIRAEQEKLTARTFAELQVKQYRQDRLLAAKIIRISELYSIETDGPENTDLFNQIFRRYLEEKELRVPNDGLDLVTPLYLHDAVLAGLRVGFGSDYNNMIYYIQGEQRYTLSHLLDFINSFLTPRLKFKYVSESENKDGSQKEKDIEAVKVKSSVTVTDAVRKLIVLKVKGLNETSSDVDYKTVADDFWSSHKASKPSVLTSSVIAALKQPLRLLWGGPRSLFRKHKKVKHLTSETYQPKEKPVLKPRQLIRRFLVIALLITILTSTILPIFISFGGAIYGSLLLRDSLKALERGDRVVAKTSARTSLLVVKASRNELQSTRWLYGIIGQSEVAKNYDSLLYISQNLASVLTKTIDASSAFEEVFKGIKSESDETKKTRLNFLIQKAKVDLDSANNEIKYAQIQAEGLDPENYPTQIPVTELKSKLPEASLALEQATQLLNVLPVLLGLNAEKTYLILLQNSDELRPTGGFIGSYGLVKLKDGSLTELKVDDIYNLEGQLSSVSSPPEELRKYLGQERLYLRDANWEPDFPTTAFQVSSLYSKLTNQDIDGVIGINLQVFKKLLNIVGPVSLSDSDEMITADNFTDKALNRTEVRFFPGSTGKRDFLGEVGQVTLERLLKLDNSGIAQTMMTLNDSIKSKDLLLFSKDAASQKYFLDQNMAGNIILPPVRAGQVNDYIFIVDSNLGINKVNQFIEQKADYNVTYDRDGVATSRLTVDYTHKSNSSSWPSGVYKDYVRVYLPMGIKDVSLQSDTSSNSDLKIRTIYGRTEVGYLLEVKPGSTKKVILSYKLPEKLARSLKNLNLYVQKQPGKELDQFTVRYEFPAFIDVANTTDTLTTTDNMVTYRGKHTQDLKFDIGILVN